MFEIVFVKAVSVLIFAHGVFAIVLSVRLFRDRNDGIPHNDRGYGSLDMPLIFSVPFIIIGVFSLAPGTLVFFRPDIFMTSLLKASGRS